MDEITDRFNRCQDMIAMVDRPISRVRLQRELGVAIGEPRADVRCEMLGALLNRLYIILA